MNRLYPYVLCLITIGLSAAFLASCQNWDLPAKKTQRNCEKPNGTLNAVTQQKKVDFSVTSNSGTIDKIVWDFGDGTTKTTTGLVTSYTYPASKTYTVKATLTNTCGQETVLQKDIAVSDAIEPTVTLQPVTDLFTTSATLKMTITANGNSAITRYGVCYSTTNPVPDITKDNVTPDRTETGTINTPYSFSLAMLQPNTTHYARSFAVNANGKTGYSSPVLTFQTGINPVFEYDTVVTNITTAIAYFRVSSVGRPAVIDYGICYSSTTASPDFSNSIIATVSTPMVGNSSVELNNLMPITKYYYRRFYRTASDKVTYGNVGSFITNSDPVSNGLVASISFTDQSLSDASGFNNNVILKGNPVFVADRKGRANAAILLNGTGDYFYMPENPNNSLNPEDLTVSIWIKPGSFAGRTQNENKRMQIYNKSRFTDSAFERYSSLIKLENDVGPGIVFITDIKQGGGCQQGKGWQDFLFTSNVDLNQWHHLVMTYTGRQARMYFDNAQLYFKDDLPASRIDPCTGGDLKFGAQYIDLPWYFSGAMDDIRIYKRAISKVEVDALFRQ